MQWLREQYDTNDEGIFIPTSHMDKSYSMQWYQRRNEFNRASLTHQRSFRDDLNDNETAGQDPREENKVNYQRTSGLGVLSPDTETPEMSQTTVSPDLL